MSVGKFFNGLEQKLEQIKKDDFYKPYIEELKALYEEDKDADITLDYQSFMYFFTTGSRIEYEKKYFTRRRQLTENLMLYLLYKEQVYLDGVCEAIWQICSQITWVYPAHLRGIEVADYRTHIDLGAAETAHSLAEVDDVLGDALPERIRALIRHEVKERIFDAFESRPYFWEKLETNWPGVCAGGVAMAYMYLAPERFETVKERIFAAMGSFMKSYGEDGSNTEGTSYWEYGFWSYLNFADILYQYSNGEIDMRHGEKVDKMAKFPQKTVMRGNIVSSFSDCMRTYEFSHVGLFSYLAKNYEGFELFKPAIISFAPSYAKPTWVLRDFLWSDPACYETEHELQLGMTYMPDAQWYVVRKEKYSLAAKGGHNEEGHNHNDVGNFIFATDEGQMIADMGAMEYTAKCFSRERYTLLQNSSRGHSVPIVDGKEQRGGMKAHANIVEVSDTKFAMELQEAYDTDMEKITRTFEVLEDGVILTDVYESIEGHQITERFISLIEPQVEGSVLKIGNVVLKADTCASISKDAVRDKKAQDVPVWLIDYEVKDSTFTLKVEVAD